MRLANHTFVPWVLSATCVAGQAAADGHLRKLEARRMPMRDGVALVADVYLPPGPGPFPAVLARSVYGRGDESYAFPFTSIGIAFVAQDTRGRGESEGADRVFQDDAWGERRDGADSVDWILAQPWCNGKVGTWGGSALGITQTLLAPATPRIACQSILVAPVSLYGQMTYRGGVFYKSQCEVWLTGQGNAQVIDLWKAKPAYDAYWQAVDAGNRAGDVTAPALHVGGWWDMFSQGTLDAFMARQAHGNGAARGNQLLVMGPWAHGGPAGPQELGDLRLHDNYRFDIAGLERRLYRHWLLGEDTGLAQEPRVHYYVLGDVDDADAPGNEWRTADTWPPCPTVTTPFYLGADGTLATTTPAAGSRSFIYDPATPCPTHGGANYDLPQGPFDQRNVSRRSDVLRFESNPLPEPMEVTGHVSVTVHLSTDAPDTDVTAKLIDVYPDGREILLLDGIQRVKYRGGRDRPEALPPGTVDVVTIDLWSISLVFNRGHRIAVHVSSSNYPRFEKNPNSGDDLPTEGNLRPAHTTVHVGPAQPSAAFLPMRTLKP